MDDVGPHPYPAGTVLSVTPHIPTTPAEARSHVPSEEESDLLVSGEWKDRVTSVIRFPVPHPPQPRVGHPRELQISQAVAGGWVHGAQVVLCNWVDQPSTTYVAKIYDPLYYEHPDRTYDWDDIPNTLTRWAHVEYVCESAAYQRIDAHRESRPMRFTPDYYGSWAFSAPSLTPESGKDQIKSSSQPQERFVYLIIIENIQGNTLQEIATTSRGQFQVKNYRRLHDDYRLLVWAQLVEAENWLEHIGIKHSDILSRNVMLEPTPVLDDYSAAVSRQSPRVVIIDFGIAKFTESMVPMAKLPPNPMSRWWHGLEPAIVREWVPTWWELDLPQRRQWLLERFGGERAEKYQKCLELCDVHELTPVDMRFLREMKLVYANK